MVIFASITEIPSPKPKHIKFVIYIPQYIIDQSILDMMLHETNYILTKLYYLLTLSWAPMISITMNRTTLPQMTKTKMRIKPVNHHNSNKNLLHSLAPIMSKQQRPSMQPETPQEFLLLATHLLAILWTLHSTQQVIIIISQVFSDNHI